MALFIQWPHKEHQQTSVSAASNIKRDIHFFGLLLSSSICLPGFQMWACALGHLEAAVVLYKWDRRAISIPDSLGRLPLGIARSRGHVKLAECLEHLQRDEQAQLGQASRIHCAPSEEPTTDSWMAQWQREAMSPPEIPKGVTVIASTNPGTDSQGFHLGTCRLPIGCLQLPLEESVGNI